MYGEYQGLVISPCRSSSSNGNIYHIYLMVSLTTLLNLSLDLNLHVGYRKERNHLVGYIAHGTHP